jgi:FKBP-type peptidyl-prolyl cis-trans isomerase FkpA
MKRNPFLIIVIASFPLLFAGCLKPGTSEYTGSCIPNNTGTPTAAEMTSLQNYLTSHNITATQHPGGFFYIIVVQGSGPAPTLSSQVTVKYTGTLENGTIFDQNPNGASFNLSQLILGWQRGLPLIQKGGRIKLYLPPSLGYGCSQAGIIPPGSNLIFDIELVDVQ